MFFDPSHPSQDQSSDSSADFETHKAFPDIFTTMSNRGVFIDPLQMSPFPPQTFSLSVRNIQPPPQITPLNAVLPVHSQTPPQEQQPQKHFNKKRKESKRTLFSDRQRSILMRWLRNHEHNPYPTSSEKQELMEQTGLNRDQINVWFTNNRVRHGMSSSSQHRNKTMRAKLFYQ